MARFSAYTSDDSDPEDDDGHSNVEQDVQSSPSPEPVVEEEEEEDDSDEETSDSSGSSDTHDVHTSPSRTPPATRVRTEPSIIPWAQHIGVDAQKMHVMQTSLFRMPEEVAALRALDQPKPSRLVVPQSLNRKHSRDSDGDGIRFESRERASFAHDIEPLPYRPSRKYARVESSASVVSGNEGAMIDSGLALGRSFRVAWGPMGVLVHLGDLCGPSSTTHASANSSVVSITRVPIFSAPDSNAAERVSTLLQHHLSNSPIEPDEAGVPLANPSSDLQFSSFVSLFSPSDRCYDALLFRLGHTLFDNLDLHLGDSVTIDIRHRIASLRRKADLSAWLEDAVALAVETDLKEHPAAGSAALAYTLLTGNQVEKACESAMDGGNVKLATLISQGAGDSEFQEDLREQLQIWREQRIDTHIDTSIRKIYALLAGVVDMVEGSKGTGIERCSDVDLVKGLDWKRTFGIHLWFSEPQDAPIAQVFQSYCRLWRDSPNRVTPPHPSYKEHPLPTTLPSRWQLPSSIPPDALFSLIKLHADPACSLSQIFTPFSFGPSPVDYSLPWHLYILLSRCMRVRDFADRGDPGLDTDMEKSEDGETRIEGHSPSADLLASSYAFQLEQIGMIQEAVFVLLHIEGFAGREKAIRDLLSRSANSLDEWVTSGLVGSLKIPVSWINEAKAIHALDKGDVWEAYELYLEAGLFNSAHEIAVLELAPDAVIRHDLDLLKKLFIKIAGHTVDGWHVRGKAFLDYIHVMTRLPELLDRDVQPHASETLELGELVRHIPKLIAILPDVLRDRSDARHNAALAVMVSSLILCLDKVQPLAMPQSQIQLGVVDEATKMRHIHSTAYHKFTQAIEVA